MKTYTYLIFFIFVWLITACQEENERIPFSSDTTVPKAISDIKAESLPGAVKLTYRIPDDNIISYVKAECMINGTLRETKATPYQNSLIINGFPDVKSYDVKVYTVSRNEILSEAKIIQVEPLTPPYQEVYETLDLFRDFGGATVSFENPNESDLAISLIYVDSLGFWDIAETYYTRKKNGTISARGFDPVETKFGVYIRDRWNNITDTLVKDLVPIFEKQLDRTKFREVKLPSDQESAWGWTMPYIWDGIIVNNINPDKPGFHTAPGKGWPHWFTFDLGVEAKLSRYKFWQRGASPYVSYNDRNIKKFEIWGSLNPSVTGEFDETWTLLLSAEVIKPSGLPLGELSDEDIAEIVNGNEFVFPPNTPITRYIRIKVLETWTGADSFYIMQVAFWGAEADELDE
ncbi:DUF5000 domain-containing lipoprotein [Proteiniphilum sp.]|nr:DUF5000 domain-containing lipoprotein [Proteiniphilum sp.]MEA4916098.1 DUF5000 domain-containing lipoprotein [Proteiniphilum sp.]